MPVDLTKVVQDYHRLVFSICYRMTGDYFEAENLAQDTFLAFINRYAGREIENTRALLCMIATNKCRDHLKSRSVTHNSPSPPENFYCLADGRASPEQQVLERETESTVAAACDRLAEPYRTVAVKYYIEDKTAPEIAHELHANKKTVQTRLYRARGMLQRLWKEEYGE